MSTIIDQINAEQMQREVPDFAPGDTVVVNLWVREGDRQRLQAFEGVVIARQRSRRAAHSAQCNNAESQAGCGQIAPLIMYIIAPKTAS